MTNKAKKSLKIALFCLIAIFALTFACSATEYSYSRIDEAPSFSNEYDIMCNYDSITFYYENQSINLQFLQMADIGMSNIYIYCSNIEKYVDFVEDNVPMGSDEVQFSHYILDEIISLNIVAEDLSSDWFTEEILSMLYENGLDFLSTTQNRYDEGFSDGYDEGFSDGFNDGKASGYNDGLTDSNALGNGIKTIFSAPVYILGGILDFELLGFSFYDFIVSIISIFLIGYIVKIFVGFV